MAKGKPVFSNGVSVSVSAWMEGYPKTQTPGNHTGLRWDSVLGEAYPETQELRNLTTQAASSAETVRLPGRVSPAELRS